jgi:hypothetical protein
MLVRFVSSHFVENRSLFVVVSVTFEYIACVCNLEKGDETTLITMGQVQAGLCVGILEIYPVH